MSAWQIGADSSASDWCESLSRMTVAEPKAMWHQQKAPNGGSQKASDAILVIGGDRSARY